MRINENIDTLEFHNYRPYVTGYKADYNILAKDITDIIQKNITENTDFAIDYNVGGVIVTFDTYNSHTDVEISSSFQIYFELHYDVGWVIIIKGINGYIAEKLWNYKIAESESKFKTLVAEMTKLCG